MVAIRCWYSPSEFLAALLSKDREGSQWFLQGDRLEREPLTEQVLDKAHVVIAFVWRLPEFADPKLVATLACRRFLSVFNRH